MVNGYTNRTELKPGSSSDTYVLTGISIDNLNFRLKRWGIIETPKMIFTDYTNKELANWQMIWNLIKRGLDLIENNSPIIEK